MHVLSEHNHANMYGGHTPFPPFVLTSGLIIQHTLLNNSLVIHFDLCTKNMPTCALLLFNKSSGLVNLS